MEMAIIVIFLHDEIPETICRTPALIELSGEPVCPKPVSLDSRLQMEYNRVNFRKRGVSRMTIPG